MKMPKNTMIASNMSALAVIAAIVFMSGSFSANTADAISRHVYNRKTHMFLKAIMPVAPKRIMLPAATPPPASSPWDHQIIYDGYGTVNWNDSSGELTMTPQVATQPSETHAGLVISTQTLQQPYELSYTMKTTQQLRTNSAPNPWEVAWGVFGYKSDGKFKYLTLKPNGLELGESLLNLAQNFLFTSSDAFPINTDYNVVMTAINNILTVKVNGQQRLQYTISNKDQLTLDGKFGFYTEDAAVKFSNIMTKQL